MFVIVVVVLKCLCFFSMEREVEYHISILHSVGRLMDHSFGVGLTVSERFLSAQVGNPCLHERLKSSVDQSINIRVYASMPGGMIQ